MAAVPSEELRMFVILLTANFKFRNRSTCLKRPMKRAGKVCGDSQDLKSPGWDSNSQPLDYKPSALAIELYSSKAIAGKELSLSSWCLHHYNFYHFSTVIDFSSEKYSSSTRHRNSSYQ